MSGYRNSLVIVILLSATAVANAQDAQPITLWRFMGIPQGFQKIRDVVTNRRGNRPGLERRDPIKRIADPANLESPNDAIKTAAKIKQAEDMKMQKIKAIKYLAKIGCGCYNADGQITKALLAATTDCTPDVRKAAIEAIEEAAGNPCCKKCGSTSCCSEEINQRLSEMAYERGDDGCPIEPNAEIRRAAARALQRCCPGGAPTGPILEEVPEEEMPTPAPSPIVPGEDSDDEMPIPGESGEGNEREEIDDESSANELTIRVHGKRHVADGEVPSAPSKMPIHNGSDSPTQSLPQPVRFHSDAMAKVHVVNHRDEASQDGMIENAPAPVRAIPLPRATQPLPKRLPTSAVSTDRNSEIATVKGPAISLPGESKPFSVASETSQFAHHPTVDNAPAKVNRIPLPLR